MQEFMEENIVAEGKLVDILKCKKSLTSQYLK